MSWVQWDGNQDHFPPWPSETLSGDTEMLLSSPPPIPSHLQHHQTSCSKKVTFNTDFH